MTWTQFHDMHSGGHQNTKWAQIFIEAPEKEAREIFTDRTGEDPDAINCICCGSNYSVTEEKGDLAQATGYERGCRFDGTLYVDEPGRWTRSGRVTPLEEYVKRDDVLVLRAPTYALPSEGVEKVGSR